MLKAVGVVALVVLVLLLAIPLGIGMVMTPCPECPSVGMDPMVVCFAVLAGFLVLALFGASAILRFEPRHRVLLLARSLDRPPRFA